MAQKSSMDRLPPQIEAQVRFLLTEGAATIHEVVDKLKELGFDRSKSSVHRYKVRIEKERAQLRRMREATKALVDELGPDAVEGKTGRMLVQILQNLVYQHLMRQLDAEDGEGEAAEAAGQSPNDLMMLARSIKDMMQAVKIDADRELKIRKEAAKEAAEVVTELAKSEGITEETQQRWRERILGLTSKAA